MIDDVNKFKSFIAPHEKIELCDINNNITSFEITPLIGVDLIRFRSLLSMFSGYFDKTDIEEINKSIRNIPTEMWDELFIYLRKSFEIYKDVPKEVIDEFISRNFINIYMKISQVNTLKGDLTNG